MENLFFLTNSALAIICLIYLIGLCIYKFKRSIQSKYFNNLQNERELENIRQNIYEIKNKIEDLQINQKN